MGKGSGAAFKGHSAVAGRRCHPLTIKDGFNRFLLTCRALEHPSTKPARRVFEAAFREYGLPDAIRSDNGVPFATTSLAGLSRLSVWWLRLGIKPRAPAHDEGPEAAEGLPTDRKAAPFPGRLRLPLRLPVHRARRCRPDPVCRWRGRDAGPPARDADGVGRAGLFRRLPERPVDVGRGRSISP
jgi:hypothetical protein